MTETCIARQCRGWLCARTKRERGTGHTCKSAFRPKLDRQRVAGRLEPCRAFNVEMLVGVFKILLEHTRPVKARMVVW